MKENKDDRTLLKSNVKTLKQVRKQSSERVYTAVTGQNAGQDFAKTLNLYEGSFAGAWLALRSLLLQN